MSSNRDEAMVELVAVPRDEIESDTERRRTIGRPAEPVLVVNYLASLDGWVPYLVCAPECWCPDCDWSQGTTWNGVRWIGEAHNLEEEARAEGAAMLEGDDE